MFKKKVLTNLLPIKESILTKTFFLWKPNMLQHCLVDLLFHGAKKY